MSKSEFVWTRISSTSPMFTFGYFCSTPASKDYIQLKQQFLYIDATLSKYKA